MSSKIEERYEGQFLDALDLPEGVEVGVVIESVADPFAERDSAKKVIKNAILAFKGKQKRLILNNTNYKNLKAMFGREPKDWIGQEIKIQRRYLEADKAFGVHNTMCVRIIPPLGTPILKSAANFMGSEKPYPTKGQSKPSRKAPAKPKSANDDELSHWLQGIKDLTTVESCVEFKGLLPGCSDAIREQVEKALTQHEKDLKGK